MQRVVKSRSAHDLLDLHNVLHACEGTDIKVYTHGEMLSAHMYPNLRNHPNLAGHYGGAWQKQKREFRDFAGSIVATTNCVLIPRPSYAPSAGSSKLPRISSPTDPSTR